MVFGGASCLCRVSRKLFGSNNYSRCRLGKFTNLAAPKKFSNCIPNVPKRCCYTLKSITRACLQRLVNKLHEFVTSFSLEAHSPITKIMIFGRNKRNTSWRRVCLYSYQCYFHLDKGQIEITHEFEYLRIDIYSHRYFEPSSKRQKNGMFESLDGHCKERNNSRSHMLGTQIPSIQGFIASDFHIWYCYMGRRLRKLLLEGF